MRSFAPRGIVNPRPVATRKRTMRYQSPQSIDRRFAGKELQHGYSHRARPEPRRAARVQAVCALTAVAMFCAGGCVRRTLTINTVPQGATIWLNDEEIGKSPVSTDFLWYGDYAVTARMEGHETLQTHQRVPAPWYQTPGLDFIFEVLWPGWIHDQHAMNFALLPAQEVDRAQLLNAAEAFRERTLNRDD
jgi:hypothetical protein